MMIIRDWRLEIGGIADVLHLRLEIRDWRLGLIAYRAFLIFLPFWGMMQWVCATWLRLISRFYAIICLLGSLTCHWCFPAKGKK